MNHIAICSDENYMPHVSALIESIYKHNKGSNISFHLVTNKVSNKTIEIIKNQIDSYEKYNLYLYNADDIKEMLGIKVPNTISISSYIRLFLPSILPSNIEKILYLDSDIIICDSLSSFFETNINNVLIAGSLDISTNVSKKKINLPEKEPYFNSGVLYINLRKWREEHLESKFLKYLHDQGGNVYHHDQGIINKICEGNKFVLPPEYNTLTAYFDFDYNKLTKTSHPFYSKESIENAKNNPIILHFTPSLSNRPWIKNCRHPLKNRYLEAKNNTNFYNKPLSKDSRPFKLKFLSFIYFNISQRLYDLIIKFRSIVN